MKNKKRVNIFLLLILLLGVSIGFAILSRQLNIFGTSNIFASKWNIHWDNIANENGMIPKTAEYIKDPAKTIVEFEMNFTDPGDYYEFTVDAVNEGTMDASLLEIKAKVNDQDISTLPSYLEYTFKYADGTEPQIGDVLGKKVGDVPGRKTYKVKIYFNEETFTEEMLEDMPDNGLDLVFTFSAKYGQAGVEAPNNFATDSWNIIASEGNEAAKQESTDGTCGAYHVGDQKTIAIDMDDDGTPENYTVRIANCSTPPECRTGGFSQTACGFVVEFTEIITTHKINLGVDYRTNGSNSIGGWKHSDMRAYLNNGIYEYGGDNYSDTGLLSKLPSDLKNVIGDTYTVSGHGCIEYSSSDSHVCTLEDNNGQNFVTTDNLYLLSPKEIYGKTSATPLVKYDAGESATRQLDYYKLAGAQDDNDHKDPAKKEIANNPNADVRKKKWWTRTAVQDLQSGWNFYEIDFTGFCEIAYPASSYGVSPAFRLK